MCIHTHIELSSYIVSQNRHKVGWCSLIFFYHPSVLVGFLSYIQCLYRSGVSKFLLVSQHWPDHVQESIEEYHEFVLASPAVPYISYCLT